MQILASANFGYVHNVFVRFPTTGLFAEGEWKPRLEGYDFLRMIDEEEEKKERDRLKTRRIEAALKRGDNEDPAWPPQETEKLAEEKKSSRLRRPEVKIHTRDEL